MDAPGNLSSASVGNLFSSGFLPDSACKSHLSDLLRTNSIPPDTSYFRSIIASSPAEISRYEMDILTLRAALDKSVSERDALKLHADRCRSVLAPIRALPPEVLLKIFVLCAQPAESDDTFGSWSRITPRQHMERLAQAHLLQLSCVCSIWRGVVMGTPFLWATIDVNLAEWLLPPNARRLTYLLSAAVDRSGSCPLRLKIRATGQVYETPGLKLLAQCSERWETANLWINSAAFLHLSFAKGKFPLLESIQIHGDTLHALDVFDGAPRLARATLRRSGAGKPPKLPWDNLRTLNYEDGIAADVRAFMSLLHRCTSLSAVHFTELDVSGLSLPLALPPVDSNIDSLGITLRNTRDSSSTHTTQAFSDILRSFTLPCARELHFFMNSLTPLVWPQHDFIAFASRSSFHDTVTSLALQNIIITDVELLDCLKELPHLEILAVADVPNVDHSAFDSQPPQADHIVVTDTLLRQLTWTPDAVCIVPGLRVFCCTSLFDFTTQVLLDFVVSRVHPVQTAVARFELQLRWHPEIPPVLDAALSRKLAALQRRGDIWYSFEAS
ncbi:hypothetical protein C8R44DRAFT_819511 [Mycena epipterygia]|nr:hypothetical protein C8R44DRAFT_819511 [Mycena epipterygia]